MLADWYHKRVPALSTSPSMSSSRVHGSTSATILAGLENTRGYNGRPVSAAPNSALLSGVGQYQCGDPDKDTPDKCTPSNKMLSYDVPRDTKLRVRLINTGGHATFRWSLDEHKVKIIEADATAVKPRTPRSSFSTYPVALLIRCASSARRKSHNLTRSTLQRSCPPQKPRRRQILLRPLHHSTRLHGLRRALLQPLRPRYHPRRQRRERSSAE